MKTLRVGLHDYSTDPLLSQKDGVNLAHENIASLLRDHGRDNLEVSFHDFNRLLADEQYARAVLEACDCVVSNVGPHAHYYFYLREQLGLAFAIVRDVRTAIWSSYLLQEYLIAPLLRAGDRLMVASHYTWGVYEKIFPHLENHTTFRCYPLTVAFPATLPPRRALNGEVFVLGYLGRLSEDKNFPDLVELLIALNRDGAARYQLLACGDIHSPSCHPDRVRARVAEALGPGDHFAYLPPRHNGEIWALYRQFDAMVFPSTSNLETLGRVLVEASYAGVPVICGQHAAAPELVPRGALCRVDYVTDRFFSSHFDHCLGRVSVEDMARIIRAGELQAPDCHLDYLRHPMKFLDTLEQAPSEGSGCGECLVLTDEQSAFIDSLEVVMPEAVDRGRALQLIAQLMPWFLALQDKASSQRQRLLADLLKLSRFPERTQRFIAKSQVSRGDFTNVGGLDIELCHIAGFYPHFSLTKGSFINNVGARNLEGDSN